MIDLGINIIRQVGPRQNIGIQWINNLNIDIAGFVKSLREEKKLAIDGGYGKIKGQTFRISNMGNETDESMSHLLNCMDEVLSQYLPSWSLCSIHSCR